MKTPTREDLQRLLFSDPASDAFEHDALHVLRRALDEEDRITDPIRDLIELVGSETGDNELGYENDEEDLAAQASTAKRGAILLLHAAWAAEQACARLRERRRPPTEDPRQLKIGGT